ncbi:MAG: hypothetical protein HZB66_02985 [Candidatus Aenigmarchaeota archaeon]|nr:hypothetical protein [Candidatus Aenigmarchaeota archaeon]
MKRKQKNQIIVIFMVLAMFGSTLGFVVMNAFPEEKKQEQKIDFIVNHTLGQEAKDDYMKRGFTLMEFRYKEGCCEDLLIYVDSIPNIDDFKVQDVPQVITQKIFTDTETPYVFVESAYGSGMRNVSTLSDVFNALCLVMVFPPTECGAAKINWTESNRTSLNITV